MDFYLIYFIRNLYYCKCDLKEHLIEVLQNAYT